MERAPFVSVVTPFYNTAAYLKECIESVLAQTHEGFEYLLVNNASTDGSREIAARYAARDSRIRLHDNEQFVDQVANYNGALARISSESKYVKIVQADDAIYPECLARMVQLAEREPTVGLVSSYWLEGDALAGTGIPWRVERLSGRDACRLMLLEGCFPIGSPSNVLYRADIVRKRKPFYRPGRYHEDTEAAYEILLDYDLGFVHQVLTFCRTDNLSITNSVRDLNPFWLDYLLVVHTYGPRVLTPEEFFRRSKQVRTAYFRFLGRALLRLPGRRFWDYHRGGLATLGWKLRYWDLVPWAAGELVLLLLEPKTTMERVIAEWRRRTARRRARSQPSAPKGGNAATQLDA